MAKISARGQHEVARYHDPETLSEYLLRSDGMVLVKWAPGRTWVTYRYYPRSPETAFAADMQRKGCVRTY